MARLHIRRKGKSKSTRPQSKTIPPWLSTSKEQIQETCIKLAREGNPPSKIGLILRDQHGVPLFSSLTGIKLSKYLKSVDLLSDMPEDLVSLIERGQRLSDHLKTNKKDKKNFHSLELIESKIHRLSKYYKKTGAIDKKWKYNSLIIRVK